MQKNYPILDLHCDLLSYLAMDPAASIHSQGFMGATLPYLKAGNVKTQVCAIFCITKPGCHELAINQAERFAHLIEAGDFASARTEHEVLASLESEKIGIYASIENASGLLAEDESITLLAQRLEELIRITGKPLYISFTHHLANRFGGGNYSNNEPLKPDGEALLALLSGKKICVDLSHSSDALAEGVLTEIAKQRYDIPVIASHSNFRKIWDHPRNLPDEFAQEIIHGGGLIGMNFVRDFVHTERPEALFEHIQYGLEHLKAGNALAFGADFFDERTLDGTGRSPIFHPQHENASKYPSLLEQLEQMSISSEDLEKLSYKNVLSFLKKLG